MIEVIGLIVAFAIIFILRTRDVEFYVSITVAAIIIGLTSGKPATILFEVLLNTVSKPDTWSLCAAVGLISVLGYALKETGLMVRFIDALSGRLPSNVLLATIPALFGFLSMPGGALMSAPFIEPEAERLGLQPEHKTYYNVWFRHLLYWTNPITSSTVMAVTLGGFTVNQWLLVQFPLFFVMVGIGLWMSKDFILRKVSRGEKTGLTIGNVKGVAPILISVVLSLSGVDIWIGLVAGILLTLLLGNAEPGKYVESFVKGIKGDIILAVVSMLYLRDIILASGSVTTLFQSILGFGVPLLAILIVVPLIIGAICGSPAMGIGISFPLLLPLLGEPNIHLTSIIFVGITSAYLASPIHLCLVLSNSYFKSDVNKVIGYLAPSSAALYIAGVLYHLALNML
jgi:integral membrane protein (TIGR00529 family)